MSETTSLNVTIAERVTKKRRSCARCPGDATGFITVSQRGGERRSGPVCNDGLCRARLVDQMIAALAEWTPVGHDKCTAAHVPDAPPVDLSSFADPEAAEAACIERVEQWWASLNLDRLEASARGHLSACVELARKSPDSSAERRWAQQRVISALGLDQNIPTDPHERTLWLLRFDRGEDWADGVAQRWTSERMQQPAGQGLSR